MTTFIYESNDGFSPKEKKIHDYKGYDRFMEEIVMVIK